MMRYSPLRYPGGKGKISSFFSELFVANNLIGGTYIEPYVGGGSIALSLLINGVANQIIINDKDRSLFAFWYSILNYTDEFCQLIENTPITIDTWYEQREIQKNKTNAELLSLGFSTFFLNRTNRSGIIKGGVIGGLNQTGNYLILCVPNCNCSTAIFALLSSSFWRFSISELRIAKMISSPTCKSSSVISTTSCVS